MSQSPMETKSFIDTHWKKIVDVVMIIILLLLLFKFFCYFEFNFNNNDQFKLLQQQVELQTIKADSVTNKLNTYLIKQDSFDKKYRASLVPIPTLKTSYNTIRDKTIKDNANQTIEDLKHLDTACNSYVKSLEIALDDCNNLVNIKDTVTQILTYRDTIRVNVISLQKEQIQLKPKPKYFSLNTGPTGVINTDGKVRVGWGVTLGFNLIKF